MLAPTLAALLSLVSGALTFQPARVPARGPHTATLQVETTGMVHLEAKSGHGVACTLVDRVSGPFASAGQTGKKDCATDQLLAAGTYKVELSGSAQARGEAVLTARPFAELNQPPQRLADGSATEQTLGAGQQASYWIHVQGGTFVWLRARGRTAGTAVLWRDGDWREPVTLHGGRRDDGGQGHPIYEWRVEQTLEEGDYLFVVYGTEPLRWPGGKGTEGKEDDTLRVEAGFPALPPSGRISATLPRGGSLIFRAPLKHVVAALELPHGMSTPTTLGVHAIGLDGGVTFDQGATCDIAARSQEPLCAVVAQSPAAQAFEVRGAPGTSFVLEVGPFSDWNDSLAARSATDRRAFGPPTNVMPFRVQGPGRYDVDLRDLPPDPDAAPLSCMLLEGTGRARRMVARDDWRLPEDGRRPVRRAFNYAGNHEVLAFALGSGRDVVISTSGERKSHCELFRVEAQSRTRVASPTGDDPTCRMPVVLTAGAYELQLDGGDEGVETVFVAPAGSAATGPASNTPQTSSAQSAKTGCKLAGVELQGGLTYQVVTSRQGSVTARSLRVHASGVDLKSSQIPEKVERADDLWRPEPALSAYTPVRRVLPVLEADKPAFFDFGRGQTHALVFEAKEAGVYTLTTEGLLATACDLRTATVHSAATREKGGRGRNCLVESYFGPGRYLATATTLGQSQGRASILLTKKSAKAAPAVTLKQPGAFVVLAGELVRQPVVVSSKRAETLEVDTQALGPDLLCRLEDADGWPLAPTSSPCHLRATLKKGRYVWMQMPLSTDTRRQTALTSTTPPRVLKGAGAHAVALNQSYQVELAAAGHDTFSFRVPAALDARVVLDHEMQGRLLRQSDDRKTWTPVEIIAARSLEAQGDEAGGAASGEVGESNAGEGEGEGEGNTGEGGEVQAADEASAANAGAEGEYHGEDESEGEPAGDDEGAAPPHPRAKPKTQAQLIAELPVLHLAAGRYRLVTEHVRGDRHIRYQLSLVTDDLLPGLARDIDVPFKGRLRLPEAGLLDLRTEGATDVTCRLFRDDVLLAESHEKGDDWNCGLSEPLPAGDYQLVIEAASLQPGPSHVVVNMATPQEGPRLDTNGGSEPRPVALKVGARPISLTLVPTAPTLPAVPATSAKLLALRLHSEKAFSWALLDAQNHVKERRQAIKDSALVLNARGEAHHLLVWSTQGTADVQANVSAPALVDVASDASGSRARVPRGSVVRVNLARAGRYGMSPDLLCASEKALGLLQPCGPEASLDAGPTLFAAVDADKTPNLALNEHAKALEGAETFALTVGPRPFLQRQTSRTQAVHLLRVRLLADVGAEPSCSFTDGVRALRNSECLALSTAAPDAIASVSLPAREAQAELTRMSWPLPVKVQPLSPGEIAVTTEKLGARAALPAGPWQVSLLLPAGAWAAVLGPAGVARDFCPPEGALSRCVLTGRDAAELWLWTPAKSEVVVTGRLLAGTEPAVATLGTERHVFESWSREPRIAKLQLPAANKARRLLVAGAEGCVLHDLDGTRLPSCNASLTPGHAYEMVLAQGTGPVRATALPAGWEATPEPLLFARPSATASASPVVTGQSVTLAGTLVARTLTLDRDAVVNVRAASGVCGLFDADAARVVRGAGDGCSLSRWLPAGRYVVAVRAFAERPLDGALVVTQRPIEGLGEGKGASQTIGPDETRLFRFDVKANGHVGLGLEVPAETLTCEVLDARQSSLGTGCQQLLSLAPGPYFLAVSAPRGAAPTRFRPVLLGLAGSEAPVPSEYLEELRERSREASAP